VLGLCLAVVVAAMLLLVALSPPAEAIPAFARRHKISCTTCHAPIPKLKPYGDEFAGDGFMMPEEEKDRELGAPASLTYQVVDGVPQVILATYGTRELLGVHADSGEVMWRYPYPAEIRIGLVSTPVAVGSRLFVCGGEGKGRNFSVCLQMQAAGGKITCRELYFSDELQTNMYNTVAVYDGAVFGFGGNQRVGFLHATSFADGRLLWKEESDDWTKDQNLVIADGLIFALTKNDELVMAEAGRERYHELGRVPLGLELGRPQQPTLANGRMYVRGVRSVVCYQIGE